MSVDEQAASISFVIPALNEESLLAGCLRSIQSLDAHPYLIVREIIVVDADSEDNTRAVALRFGASVVSAPRGNVSVSRNTGAKAASGDLIGFVDADCVLPINLLSALSLAFRREGVIAVGAEMAEPSEPATWVERTWYRLAHRSRKAIEAEDVDWLPTFNLFVRSSAMSEVGGFDTSLETCEDVDIGYRLRRIGRLHKLHDVSVEHKGESKNWTEFYQREAWRARGNARHLINHRDKPSEWITFLVPIIYTFSAAAIVMAAVGFFFGFQPKNALAISAYGVTLAAAPVLTALTFLRRRLAIRFWLSGAAMLGVYFVARAVGSLVSVGRVSR